MSPFAYLKVGDELKKCSISAVSNESDPGYDIVVGLIQSNMRGVAEDYISSDQYNSDVYMWHHGSQSIVPASEPISVPEVNPGMGAMNTFVKDYQNEVLAPNRKVLIVNVARGGTGFTLPSTNSGGTGLHWRQDLADDTNNLALRGLSVIQSAISAAGPNSEVVAYLANHGSTDGTNNTPKATFKSYLQSYITWLRTTLNTPTTPYVMMQMRPDLVANETRHRIIDEAQTETATELINVKKALSPVGSEYYRGDSVHFNALGMRVIGHNLFDQWSLI